MASWEERGPSKRLGLGFPVCKESSGAKPPLISPQIHVLLKLPPWGLYPPHTLLEALLYHRLPWAHLSGHVMFACRIQSKGLHITHEVSPWLQVVSLSLTLSPSLSLPTYEITAPKLSLSPTCHTWIYLKTFVCLIVCIYMMTLLRCQLDYI